MNRILALATPVPARPGRARVRRPDRRHQAQGAVPANGTAPHSPPAQVGRAATPSATQLPKLNATLKRTMRGPSTPVGDRKVGIWMI